MAGFAEKLFSELTKGSRTALARAISLLESTHPDHRSVARRLVNDALTFKVPSPAFRLAITGPPGAGKSTFMEAFGLHAIEQHGRRVAVLAIDPSSSITGGSLLGDRTRMLKLAQHERSFVRPSPSGRAVGGVARATSDSILLCEAAGYDMVLVETVGSGQSDFAAADMVDMFCLLVPPAAGDDVQALKRGVMELVDLVVVNKCDGELVVPARRAAVAYSSALRLLRSVGMLSDADDGHPGHGPVAGDRVPKWAPRVLKTSALKGDGLEEIYEAMSEFGSIIDLHTLGRPKTVSRPQLRPDIPEQKTNTHSSSEAQSARPSPSGRYSPVTMTLRTPQPVSSCATSQSQREPEYLVRRRDQQVRAFRRSLHERTLEAVLGRASPVSLREELALLEAKVRAGALTPGDATDTALDKVLRAAAGTSGSEDMKMMNTK